MISIIATVVVLLAITFVLSLLFGPDERWDRESRALCSQHCASHGCNNCRR